MTGGVDAAPPPIETELKYRMTDRGAGMRLLAADELAGFRAATDVTTVRHEDRYLDTADGALAAAGWAARLRDAGAAGVLVTLKSLHRQEEPEGRDALHRRDEMEAPATAAAEPSAWPPSEARSVLEAAAAGAPLAELVTLRQVRTRRAYVREGARVEVSLDDVEVVASGRPIDRFAELEVELVEGGPDVLTDLAALLAEVEELVPAETSKLERALDAAHRDSETAEADAGPGEAAEAAPPSSEATGPRPTPTAVEALASLSLRSPGTLGDDQLAEAGRKVLRFHLARMVAREPGTRAGRPEELKAMRVATRRQRAAWRVFGDAFDPAATRRHRRRLRRVAGKLGAVRDLDVLIEAGEAYRDAQGGTEGAGFEPLLADWRRRRETARDALMAELDSPGYRRWLEAYAAFVQREGAGVRVVAPTDPHRVRDRMPSRIWAAFEQLRAYEPVLRWADIPTIHSLRIAAKWLRYTVEFVREPLGPAAGPLIERVVAIQDHLGWMNDAEIAAGLARAFLTEHAGTLSEMETAAIGRYLVDREREVQRLRRSMGPAWRGVSSLAFRRALGRVVAGL